MKLTTLLKTLGFGVLFAFGVQTAHLLADDSYNDSMEYPDSDLADLNDMSESSIVEDNSIIEEDPIVKDDSNQDDMPE